MRSTTSISSTSLRPPRQPSFRKSLGGSTPKSSLPPKSQNKPSTFKKLPIVGISA